MKRNQKKKAKEKSSLRQASASHVEPAQSKSAVHEEHVSAEPSDTRTSTSTKNKKSRPNSSVARRRRRQAEDNESLEDSSDSSEERRPGAFREGGRSEDTDDENASESEPPSAPLEQNIDIEAPRASTVDKNELVEELREEIIDQYLQQAPAAHATAVVEENPREDDENTPEGVTKSRRSKILLTVLALTILIAIGVGVGVALSSSSSGDAGSSGEEENAKKADPEDERKPSNPPTGIESDDGSTTQCLANKFDDNSCISGDQVCRFSTNLCTEASSCSGDRACRETSNVIVGRNSCNGHSACNNVTGAVLSPVILSPDSCNSIGSCRSFAGNSIGPNSCNCPGCCDCYLSGALSSDIPSDSCNLIGECCNEGLAEIATSLSTTESLQDTTSSQYLGFARLLTDSLNMNANWSFGYGVLQRYVLAVFFISTDGDNWFQPPPTSWFGDRIEEVVSISFLFENLNGTIPIELGALTALTELDIEGATSLICTIPSELGNLSALRELRLPSNLLDGRIPLEIGFLSELGRLDLSRNDFTGTIPTEIASLTSLEHLDLSWNSRISGTIPSELGMLTMLTHLSLSWSNLSGSIPSELGQLTALTHLSLNGNTFSGLPPSQLGQLTNLMPKGCYDDNFNYACDETTPLTMAPTSTPINCDAGTTLFHLVLTTDQRPQEISWAIFDATDTAILASSPYTEPLKLYESMLCIEDPVESYNFVLQDSSGDGLCCSNGQGDVRLFYGRQEIQVDPQFGSRFEVELVVT